jgi:tetratricopeptide (TPR) repeat protein
MNRFYRSLLSILFLSYALPFLALAQESQEINLGRLPDVPPPSSTSTAAELEVRGDSLRAQKDYLDALDYYKAAAQKNDSAILHNKMGVSWLQLSKYLEARKEFERSVKLDKGYAEAHNNLAVVHYVNRQYSSAVKEYQKAIRINPDSASFHSNLGSAYFSRKDFEKANREYSRAMELDPSIFDPTPSGGVSVKLATQGDRAYFFYMIAKTYGSRGDVDRCRLYLSKANEVGYPHVKDALKDGEFAVLRKNPDFIEFVRSLKPPPPLEAHN